MPKCCLSPVPSHGLSLSQLALGGRPGCGAISAVSMFWDRCEHCQKLPLPIAAASPSSGHPSPACSPQIPLPTRHQKTKPESLVPVPSPFHPPPPRCHLTLTYHGFFPLLLVASGSVELGATCQRLPNPASMASSAVWFLAVFPLNPVVSEGLDVVGSPRGTPASPGCSLSWCPGREGWLKKPDCAQIYDVQVYLGLQG